MGARVVTVNEVLGGHVKLDIECLDRIYLNAYVPILQSSGQVVAFMTQHLGLPIPSPALFDKIGQKFRRAVASFAEADDIPWVKFAKDVRKADVMAPHLKRQRHLAGRRSRRSGWRRSSSGCGPPTGGRPARRRRSSPSPRLTGG
jgi:hypothetical protein